MQIVVGGRFDYIRTAWDISIRERNIMYFENEKQKPLKLKDKIRRKIHYLLKKCKVIRAKTITRFEILDNLNEYFEVYSLKRNKPVLFILYEMNFLSTDFESLKLLKNYFKKCRVVFFFSNVIGTVRESLTKQVLDNKNIYDLIYTFNEVDGKLYNLRTFAGGVFPYNIIPLIKDENYKSDVFWVGKNKGRLQTLQFIKRQLEEKGFTTRFIITGEELECESDGIFFREEGLKYEETLKYIYNAKALLDLSWGGVPSLRYTEAIAYSKLLITDNAHVINNNACIKLENLDKESIEMDIKWDYTIDQISTDRFIEEVVSLLNFNI